MVCEILLCDQECVLLVSSFFSINCNHYAVCHIEVIFTECIKNQTFLTIKKKWNRFAWIKWILTHNSRWKHGGKNNFWEIYLSTYFPISERLNFRIMLMLQFCFYLFILRNFLTRVMYFPIPHSTWHLWQENNPNSSEGSVH